MASWQLSHTLTSNSKPIKGMEERLELHLPQTAFPHLRQWCWRRRENRGGDGCAWPQLWPLTAGMQGKTAQKPHRSTADTFSFQTPCVQNEGCWRHTWSCVSPPPVCTPASIPSREHHCDYKRTQRLGGLTVKYTEEVPSPEIMLLDEGKCGRNLIQPMAYHDYVKPPWPLWISLGKTKLNHEIRLKMICY